MNKDKDIIEIIVDEPSETSSDRGKKYNFIVKKFQNSFISRYLENLPNDLSPRFIKISCAVCACVLIIAAALGVIIPKSDSVIEYSLSTLREKDKTYLAAKESSDNALQEIEQLNTRLSDDEKSLEEFKQSQDNLDKISQSNDELQAERDSLQSEVSSKQKQLDELNSSINANANKSVTFTSGRYTVGTNIAAGKYTVTGTGSIVISNSGTARVNKTLKSDGESFTLSNGDVIKIDGSARFIPE